MTGSTRRAPRQLRAFRPAPSERSEGRRDRHVIAIAARPLVVAVHVVNDVVHQISETVEGLVFCRREPGQGGWLEDSLVGFLMLPAQPRRRVLPRNDPDARERVLPESPGRAICLAAAEGG